MGLSTHTSFVKIKEAVLADGSITLADIKMPSFDPRGLGITFTDPELAYLKQYWGKHWQLNNIKGHLCRAWLANQHDNLEKGKVKGAMLDMFADLETDGVSEKTALKIIESWINKRRANA